MKKITKKSTLKTNIVRLILAVLLVLAQASTSVTAVWAASTETVSNTSTVTVDGVKYTTLLKQGQVQLTVGSKVILLSKENVMAAANLDKYGTVWMISYSGRCSGYNYSLQSNEPSVNLHTYVTNAESFVLDSNNLATEIQTTTGKVSVPNLEEFKKLAGFTSSNNNTSGENTSTGNNTGNNNSNTGSTSGSLNLVETKKIGSTQYIIVVTNGIAQITIGNRVITIPDIYEIGLDANGTIIFITNNNGIKEARWYSPSLQTQAVKTNLLASNANCLLKDSNGLVTGVVANSSIVKVLTVDEQKKILGIASTSTTENLNLVETKKVGTTQYTIVVTNGIAQVVIGDKVITIPDKNICQMGLDANGTIIFITNNNGVKEARWYSPSLQTKEVKTNLLASNANCLLKDSNGLVTGVLANSSIVKVLTVDEQKKILGIATIETTTTTKVNEERVTKVGDYTYSVYNSDGKRLTSFVLKNGTLTWHGVKYKNIKRVGVIQKSKNLVLTTTAGSVVKVNYKTMKKTTIFKASKTNGKAIRYTINSKGFTDGYVTSKGKRVSVKNY